MPNPMASGSDSASGGSSDTSTEVTSTSQEEGAPADMVVAMAAHQAAAPIVDGPLPTRRLPRKPNRKTAKSEAAVTSPIRKRGRRPKAAGKAPYCSSPLRSILVT